MFDSKTTAKGVSPHHHHRIIAINDDRKDDDHEKHQPLLRMSSNSIMMRAPDQGPQEQREYSNDPPYEEEEEEEEAEAADAVKRHSIGSKKLTFRRLFLQAKPERKLLIIATVALFLGSILNMAVPAFVGAIIDVISAPPNFDFTTSSSWLTRTLASVSSIRSNPHTLLTLLVLCLAVLIVSGAVFSTVRGWLFNLAGERVVARLRVRLFEACIRNEIAFFDVTRTGELVNRLSADTTTLKDAATINLSMGLRECATVIFGIAYLFFISWKLTLVMLSVVPLVAIAGVIYGRRIRELSKKIQEKLAHSTEIAEESYSQIRTVRSFYLEPKQIKDYSKGVNDTYELGARVALFYGLFIGLIAIFAGAAMILVMWYGSTLVLDGTLTAGVLTSFVLYTLTVGISLGGMAGLYSSLMSALGASERVFELLDRQSLIPIEGAGIRPNRLVGQVKLDNVTFRYPARQDMIVLKSVSITLEPGTVTALVGPSGSGKTTCVALIERFYDLDGGNGRILIDNIDIRDLDSSWIHQNVALVGQDPVLFASSIRDNLTMGKTNQFTDADIKKACEMANAAEFIEKFPEKYDTMVGERGVRLSGGQRQRVAIARALLMNPRVLIADEATSALDSESEYHVQQALDRLMAGRTTLVIAHRLSTVKNASTVIVMHHGEVVERGTHDELLAQSGSLYAKLVRRQLQHAPSTTANGVHEIDSLESIFSSDSPDPKSFEDLPIGTLNRD